MTMKEQIEEIKKALDKEIRCAEYVQEEYADSVKVSLLEESLNIITKQEQEIEQLSRDYVVKGYDKLRAENAKLQKQVDEVRKETAKEILTDLYYNLQISVRDKLPKSDDYYNVLGWLEELAEEYNVEVINDERCKTTKTKKN